MKIKIITMERGNNPAVMRGILSNNSEFTMFFLDSILSMYINNEKIGEMDCVLDYGGGIATRRGVFLNPNEAYNCADELVKRLYGEVGE